MGFCGLVCLIDYYYGRLFMHDDWLGLFCFSTVGGQQDLLHSPDPEKLPKDTLPREEMVTEVMEIIPFFRLLPAP